METKKMPATVIENIKGRELPADWQRKMKAIPDESYSVSIQPQRERETFLDVVRDIRRNAKKRGMTPEILADALGVDVKEMR